MDRLKLVKWGILLSWMHHLGNILFINLAIILLKWLLKMEKKFIRNQIIEK